ncbi:MAG: zinc transport system ATP-binding protein [Pseudohongiellaceae bacterium]|jgi:zinc transport system ATP-binding protein
MASPNLDSSTLIAAYDVSKVLEGRTVLDNVSLEIKEGKIVTLIGPNGAGKTTLVRIILGLMTADSGIVSKRPDLNIGYMPQKLVIDPTMPIAVSRFLELSGSSDPDHLRDTLAQLKIPHLLNSPLTSVSGGEMQRVLLARAMLRKPQLLVLDEPAQGVDVSGQAELYGLISEIRDQHNCGVIMISHDLHLVMSSTDEVVCLNHHVCCHGEPEHVSNDPAFLDLFGARSAESLAIYTHNHNHEHDVRGQIKPPQGE